MRGVGEGGRLVGGGGDVGHDLGHGVGVDSGIDTATHSDARSTMAMVGEGATVGVLLGRAVGVGFSTGSSSSRCNTTRVMVIISTAAAARVTGAGPPRPRRALETRNPRSSSFTGPRYLIRGTTPGEAGGSFDCFLTQCGIVDNLWRLRQQTGGQR